MNQILLSVCIPTYNRPEFIRKQIIEFTQITDSSIFQVFIGDNSENNSTEDIIKPIINNNGNILFIKNKKNLGATQNIFNLVKKTEGKFLWILGDDDFISKENFTLLLGRLKSLKEESCINMNRIFDESRYNHTYNDINFDEFSKEAYLMKTGIWLSHLSSNIIPNKIRDWEGETESEFFPQTEIILKNLSLKNYIVPEKLVYCTPRNTLSAPGLNQYRIFHEDYLKIYERVLDKNLNFKNKVIRIIDRILLIEFYPQYLKESIQYLSQDDVNQNIEIVKNNSLSKFDYYLGVYPRKLLGAKLYGFYSTILKRLYKLLKRI
jgi:glycosyltransferase involved in cell wall biosynthesis